MVIQVDGDFNGTPPKKGVAITGRNVYIDGQKHKVPGHIKMNNTTVIDSKVFINGYELKNGRWRRTLRATFHKFF